MNHPNGLQHFAIGDDFNQSLVNANSLSGLQHVVCVDDFNQSLEKLSWVCLVWVCLSEDVPREENKIDRLIRWFASQ